MITLRLEPKVEQAVNTTAKILGLTKSELIRQSINEYLDKIERQDPWKVGKDLFGRYSSGDGKLSSDRKERFKNKVRAKRG